MDPSTHRVKPAVQIEREGTTSLLLNARPVHAPTLCVELKTGHHSLPCKIDYQTYILTPKLSAKKRAGKNRPLLLMLMRQQDIDSRRRTD